MLRLTGILAAVIGGFFYAAAAVAQPQTPPVVCVPAVKAERQLQADGMVPVVQGVTAAGELFVLQANPDNGEWLVTVQPDPDTMCLLTFLIGDGLSPATPHPDGNGA